MVAHQLFLPALALGHCGRARPHRHPVQAALPAPARNLVGHLGREALRQPSAHSAGFASRARAFGSCGSTSARSLALGASTPWLAQRGSAHVARRSYANTRRIRCSRGLGTSAASRCLNLSGDITRRVVPSRPAVSSLITTCPAALVCTRSLASAGRVM